MATRRIPIEHANNAIGAAARWAFLGAIGTAPLIFGGNIALAWGLNAVLASAIAIGFSSACQARGGSYPVPARWYRPQLICASIVVLWILLQQSALTPGSWHHQAWRDAAGALNEPLPGYISVDPWATRLGLLRLATAGLIFWLGLQIGRDAVWARRIVAAVAISAAVYAIWGLASAYAVSDQILWMHKPFAHAIPTATFINPNHFAAYACIGLAAAFSLAIHEWHRISGSRTLPSGSLVISALKNFDLQMAILIATCAVLWAAVIATGSRAGLLLSSAAIVTILGIEVLRSRRRTSILGLSAVLALVATAYLFLGPTYRISEELALTRASDLDARIAVAKITLRAIADAPFTGFGYATFSEVFPVYRDASISLEGVWLDAHNPYLEAMLGLGVPAAGVLFYSILWPVWRCISGALRRKRDHTAPLAAAAAAAVLGLHGLFDFSIQLQGITLPFAALLGCGTAQSWSSLRRIE